MAGRKEQKSIAQERGGGFFIGTDSEEYCVEGTGRWTVERTEFWTDNKIEWLESWIGEFWFATQE